MTRSPRRDRFPDSRSNQELRIYKTAVGPKETSCSLSANGGEARVHHRRELSMIAGAATVETSALLPFECTAENGKVWPKPVKRHGPGKWLLPARSPPLPYGSKSSKVVILTVGRLLWKLTQPCYPVVRRTQGLGAHSGLSYNLQRKSYLRPYFLMLRLLRRAEYA